ncbi:MAG: hypothetical protein U1E05_00555, partial [Patescibacteria group bacterium]|nr:hypothetical protein [Patescibacteria group bacterium]
ISLAFSGAGIAQAFFVASWWLATGFTTPWTALVTIGAACIILGIAIGTMALMADQLGRVRRIQEEILVRMREDQYMRHDRREGCEE